MANEEQLAILRQGVEVWNKWRTENHNTRIDLSKADLNYADLRGANLVEAFLLEANLSAAKLSGTYFQHAILIGAKLSGADLSGAHLLEAHLSKADLRGAYLSGADLNRADLSRADLSAAHLNGAILKDANLSGAVLNGANLSAANLGSANLNKAQLEQADLTGAFLNKTNLGFANLSGARLNRADLKEASLIGADLSKAILRRTILVRTRVDKAIISGSSVYGISVWDLEGEFEAQKDLVITPPESAIITVDNIKVAQFIYLILNNKEIRDVINTLTSKSVLILGRFAIPERKDILDALRNKLREYNLLPIVFDFERPTDKDYTETVQALAALSLFVIVDVTNPKSTPLEMEALVKQFKIPYVPIIDLSADKNPFAMMVDSQKSFHWVLPTFGYQSKDELLENIDEAIIHRALQKHNELRVQKATEPEILTMEDLKKGKNETKRIEEG